MSKLLKPFMWVHKIISAIILQCRKTLNNIREKQPDRFDKAVKIATFLIPFASCFAPALVTNNWSRAILEFIVLSLILVFQWSTFTNRIAEKENAIESFRLITEKQKQEIAGLRKDTNEYCTKLGDNESKHNEELVMLNQQFDTFAGFSHSVSHNVKKIIAELQQPIDSRVVVNIAQFLQGSLNPLESILSIHYGKEIRASIKITTGGNTVKTYIRGKNNMISRGGEYHCSLLNEKEINISENYAYEAIVLHGRQFFAEGNLLEMHNKFKPEDVFYCEYGKEYTKIFRSTIVMPIRIPVYEDVSPEQQEPSQEILGLLCIDCEEKMPEWSKDNLREKRAYHIIADYADSLAILMKEYRDASKEGEKEQAD